MLTYMLADHAIYYFRRPPHRYSFTYRWYFSLFFHIMFIRAYYIFLLTLNHRTEAIIFLLILLESFFFDINIWDAFRLILPLIAFIIHYYSRLPFHNTLWCFWILLTPLPFFIFFILFLHILSSHLPHIIAFAFSFLFHTLRLFIFRFSSFLFTPCPLRYSSRHATYYIFHYCFSFPFHFRVDIFTPHTTLFTFPLLPFLRHMPFSLIHYAIVEHISFIRWIISSPAESWYYIVFRDDIILRDMSVILFFHCHAATPPWERHRD